MCPLHPDAIATVGNIPVDVNELNVDLLSLSGVSFGAQAMNEAIKDYEEKEQGRPKSATRAANEKELSTHTECGKCNAQNP